MTSRSAPGREVGEPAAEEKGAEGPSGSRRWPGRSQQCVKRCGKFGPGKTHLLGRARSSMPELHSKSKDSSTWLSPVDSVIAELQGGVSGHRDETGTPFVPQGSNSLHRPMDNEQCQPCQRGGLVLEHRPLSPPTGRPPTSLWSALVGTGSGSAQGGQSEGELPAEMAGGKFPVSPSRPVIGLAFKPQFCLASAPNHRCLAGSATHSSS